MVGKKLAYYDAISYISSVMEAIEPEEYEEFVKVLKDYTVDGIDYVTAFSRVEKLLKGHRSLILGFTLFVPPDDKSIVFPLEAAESNHTKTKRAMPDLVNFMNKLQTRFRSLDTHVVESFQNIMNKYQQRKKSERKMHKEVINLLYYHEDLLEEFFQTVGTKTNFWSQYYSTKCNTCRC